MRGVLEEQIRHRAHHLYEERGYKDGHAVEDWLRAEREVRGFASRRGGMEAEPRHQDPSPRGARKQKCDCA
jgi:Protein of unknown function (DUF2934)